MIFFDRGLELNLEMCVLSTPVCLRVLIWVVHGQMVHIHVHMLYLIISYYISINITWTNNLQWNRSRFEQTFRARRVHLQTWSIVPKKKSNLQKQKKHLTKMSYAITTWLSLSLYIYNWKFLSTPHFCWYFCQLQTNMESPVFVFAASLQLLLL